MIALFPTSRDRCALLFDITPGLAGIESGIALARAAAEASADGIMARLTAAWPPAHWRILRQACEVLGIGLVLGVEDDDALDAAILVRPAALQTYAEQLGDGLLLRSAAETGLPLVLGAGIGGMAAIERAVDLAEKTTNRHLVLRHGAPARLGDLELRRLTSLRMMFPEYVTGYGDYGCGTAMAVAAVTLGAQVVDKGLVLRAEDRPVGALTPSEARRFVVEIRAVEKALGPVRRAAPSGAATALHG